MGWVLFFDGECAFCSDSVRWISRLDRRGKISFAPLQGKLAAEKSLSGYAAGKGGTLVLFREEDGRLFTKSNALIELTRALGGWWRLLAVARFIPPFLRDAVYQWVADNRYRIMGKSDSCSLPDPVVLNRLRE